LKDKPPETSKASLVHRLTSLFKPCLPKVVIAENNIGLVSITGRLDKNSVIRCMFSRGVTNPLRFGKQLQNLVSAKIRGSLAFNNFRIEKIIYRDRTPIKEVLKGSQVPKLTCREEVSRDIIGQPSQD
jgi:hypothetical protein